MSTLLSAQNDISGEIAVLDSLGECQAGLEALAAKWAEGGHSAVLTANLCGKAAEQHKVRGIYGKILQAIDQIILYILINAHYGLQNIQTHSLPS